MRYVKNCLRIRATTLAHSVFKLQSGIFSISVEYPSFRNYVEIKYFRRGVNPPRGRHKIIKTLPTKRCLWRLMFEQRTSRVVKNDFLLRISLVGLQLRWSPRKNPQRISEDTPPVFSQSPPRFVSTIKMLTTEPFFTTLLGRTCQDLTSYLKGIEHLSHGPVKGGMW